MELGFSLGSNLGDRLALLAEAKRRMLLAHDAVFVAQSCVYETEPVGVRPEHRDIPYLNAVLVLESAASAREWLQTLGAIERAMGRVRTDDRNAPRTIDIDILYADDARIDGGGLVVPHPRWAERRFVVQPLADVRPELTLPGAGKTVAEILAALPEAERVVTFAEQW